MKNISIAIDGPSGSGKSTIAKIIASKLNITYIDTGAMYRAFTLGVLQNNLDPKNEEACNSLIGKLEIGFDDENKCTLNGVDVSKEIRGNDVADNVSYIASYKNIRLALVEEQRKLARSRSVIMDGRDIGTYVLQDASIKFYQICDVKERARRRYLENVEKGIPSSEEECLANLEKRDYIDSHRDFCPLRPAEDSIEIDTTYLNIEQVTEKLLSIMKEKGLI